MRRLSKIWIIRVLFYADHTAQFFVFSVLAAIYKIFKIIYYYCKKFFYFCIVIIFFYFCIVIILDYFNLKELSKIIEIDWAKFSNINSIQNKAKNNITKIFPIDEIYKKNESLIDNSSHILGRLLDLFFNSKITLFIVLYSTYFFLKEGNPMVFINIDKYDKTEFTKILQDFIKKEYNISKFGLVNEQIIVDEIIDLVPGIFNQMIRSDKTAEKIGVNYLLWTQDYIYWNLFCFLFKQFIFFRKFKFSKDSKKFAVIVVKLMLDHSRYHPYSKYSKYIRYEINF